MNGKGRRENGDPSYLGGIISLELLRKNNAGIREIGAPDESDYSLSEPRQVAAFDRGDPASSSGSGVPPNLLGLSPEAQGWIDQLLR